MFHCAVYCSVVVLTIIWLNAVNSPASTSSHDGPTTSFMSLIVVGVMAGDGWYYNDACWML